MDNLVFRLLSAAAEFDKEGKHIAAKLLTEAVKEIENARKGHIRNPANESTKPEGNE